MHADSGAFSHALVKIWKLAKLLKRLTSSFCVSALSQLLSTLTGILPSGDSAAGIAIL